MCTLKFVRVSSLSNELNRSYQHELESTFISHLLHFLSYFNAEQSMTWRAAGERTTETGMQNRIEDLSKRESSIIMSCKYGMI